MADLSEEIKAVWNGENKRGREERHRVISELVEEQDAWRQAADEMLFRAQRTLASGAAHCLARGQADIGDRLRELAADIRQLLGVDR